MGPLRLYLITDRASVAGGDLPGAVRAALAVLPRGCAGVQLRERDLSASDLLGLARALLPICRAAQAPLLVNDRLDVARAAGADGVHLPAASFTASEARQVLGAEALVGASCHSLAEVAAAAEGGADFCVFGPVWETPGKGPALGLAELAGAVRAAALPVFALGGVDPRTAPLALQAGARGVACIRAVLGAADPAAAAIALWQSLGRAEA